MKNRFLPVHKKQCKLDSMSAIFLEEGALKDDVEEPYLSFPNVSCL